jgi:hypothetical protein
MSQNLVEALPNQNDMFMLKIERENVWSDKGWVFATSNGVKAQELTKEEEEQYL